MEPVKETTVKSLPLETLITKSAAFVLRALNNPLRQKIIKVIHTQKRVNVTDIYIRLRLEQSVASMHLAILRNEGFVNTERVGTEIYYSINYDRFAEVDKLVKGILK